MNGNDREIEYAVEEEIKIGEYFSVFRHAWWKIFGVSFAVGIVTLLVVFQFPDVFRATAIIKPATTEKNKIQPLGVLASFGISLGAPTEVRDLEVLFKSKDLTVRVFRKYNLWEIIFPERFDPLTGTMQLTWRDRLFEKEKEPKPPGKWDAIRAAEDRLEISTDKKLGTLTIIFDCLSAEGAAEIVKYYLEEGKTWLQEETLERAKRNKKFIEEQISKTVDPLTRDRLFTLYGQEVEQEMLARNREQFGFRVIDSPIVPDRKYKPSRTLIVVGAALVGFIAAYLYFLGRQRKKLE